MARIKLTWTIDSDALAQYAAKTLAELETMLARMAQHPSVTAEAIEAELEHVVNERRRAQGLPIVRNAHKPFRLHVREYRTVAPKLVDGRYVSAEKVFTGPGRIIGFDTARKAEDYRHAAAMKIGNCDIAITGPDAQSGRRFLTPAQLKAAARKEFRSPAK